MEIYINLNPTALTIRGLIKIHKTNSPIRPVVNWQNAPAYILEKMLSKKLQAHIPLPYTFNITNSIQLINDLKFLMTKIYVSHHLISQIYTPTSLEMS